MNAYGYCWGNPITFVDLNGKIPLANPSNATKSSSTGSAGNTGQTKSKSSSFYSQEEQWAQLENTCKIIKSRMAILDVAGEAEVEKYPKNSPKKTCF